ncbi:MAG: prepilin-type N-terminal cleavage/methylation domain-containing protein [Candidatus Omnitrophica bacterium]|nr:prepilin-type N-terminal cleavage/methylation domain-containing protein [Candidatus Omnitrophota bacterium]
MKAFSLLELLMVVVIFSVVAVLSVPNFKNTYAGLTTARAMNDVAYAMRYAARRAAIEGAFFKMVFADNAFALFKAAVDDNGKQADFVPLTGTMGRRILLPSDIKVSDAPAQMIFSPDGSMDKVKITFEGGGKHYIVSTQEARGRVFVSEEKP